MKTKTKHEAENDNSSVVVSEKNYSIKWLEYADEQCSMERRCDGFNVYELLGIFTLTQQEIIDQIKGIIKPDFTKREVVI